MLNSLEPALILVAILMMGPVRADSEHHQSGKHLLSNRQHGKVPLTEHWIAPAEATGRRNPIAANQASIERGQRLYQRNCTSCHGDSGAGDGPAASALPVKPTNLIVLAPQHSDGDFAWKITHGRSAMPGWQASLSTQQIWDLVNFIKSLSTAAGTQPNTHKHGEH
jgi:mono/diheme cytochrome c family protein